MAKRYTPRYSRRRVRRPSRFPSATFGKMYYPRDTPFGLDRWGSTAALANPLQLANRRADGWVGRGKYQPGRNFRSWASKAVRDVGRGVGSAVNQKILGAISGQGLYGGQGSYTDEGAMNQLMDGGRSAPITVAANDETDSLILSDCEFVKDIYAGSVANIFAQQSISVNPGIPSFAPNLAQIAVNYTEYELLQLVFELRPVISENNVNNGQSGIAMMVFNYNPNEDPFDNKEDVMQAHGSVSGRIVEKIVCGVECDIQKTNKTKFFIRNGPVPFGKDADEYDHGVLTIATNNVPSAFVNTQIFELWVSYTVKLRKRKAGALRLLNQQRDIFYVLQDSLFSSYITSLINQSSNGGLSAGQQNNIGCLPTITGVYASNTLTLTAQLTFPADLNGLFSVRLHIEGSGLSISQPGNWFGNSGNVSNVFDILTAMGSNSADLPETACFITSSSGSITEHHVKVKSATGGAENITQLTVSVTAGTINSLYLEVIEFSPSQFTSRTSQRPLLINVASGAVTTF